MAVVPNSFLESKIFKAYANEEFIGFYKLLNKGNHAELDGLWILPEFHGKGFGRSIIEHAIGESSKLGYSYIKLYADPNVNGFYEKVGGKLISKKETLIKNRYLNIYQFSI